jgi:hypothetical protein
MPFLLGGEENKKNIRKPDYVACSSEKERKKDMVKEKADKLISQEKRNANKPQRNSTLRNPTQSIRSRTSLMPACLPPSLERERHACKQHTGQSLILQL